MNYLFVLRQISRLLASLSAILLGLGALAALWAWGLGDSAERPAAIAFAISGAIGLGLGGAGWLASRRGRTDLERREALLLVTLSWLLGAALSALPYLLWARLLGAGPATGELPAPARALAGPVNCYFEAMSGLTTTGATILTGIDELPRSLLLWRATTHWIGGLGIVVLFVAVLPSVGVAGKRLFTVEAAGPSPRGVRPEVRETARVLLIIYSALTLALLLLLRSFGMSWFDAVCHSFATLATGGFSTADASIGAWSSGAIQWILILFMILGGINFGLYYRSVRQRSFALLRDTELRVYLVTIALVALLCFGLLLGRPIVTTAGAEAPTGALTTLRHATFQAASIHTTTGFCTADFDLWPTLAKGALVLLMFVGGCAGSTAGGIKVIRLWIALRLAVAQIERTFRPNVVRPLRVGGQVVSEEVKLDTLAYILAFVLLWLIGTGVLLAIEAGGDISFATAATASVSALGTIGPGLARVGAIQNYAWMSDASKLLLCGWMLMARLEIFPVIVLLSMRFWRE